MWRLPVQKHLHMLLNVDKLMNKDNRNWKAAQQPLQVQNPHINVPWPGEMAMATCVQPNAHGRTRQRLAFPLGDNLAVDLMEDQRTTLTGIMAHPWKDSRSTQCDRTQRSISWDVLHNQIRSWQSCVSAICYPPEKFFPRFGKRWNWWNWRLLGLRWRRRRRSIPACCRGYFLGSWWRWLHMVYQRRF